MNNSINGNAIEQVTSFDLTKLMFQYDWLHNI